MPATTESFPVAIHQGTCANPTAEPAYKIGDIRGFIDSSNQVIPRDQYRGTLTTPPVLTSGVGVSPKLDDLLGGTPYVILVHKSAQDYTTYVACGEIGGPVVNDQLVVALRPLNGSGYYGVAVLHQENIGSNGTTGNIYLFSQETGASGGLATPATQARRSHAAGPLRGHVVAPLHRHRERSRGISSYSPTCRLPDSRRDASTSSA